MNPIMQLEQVKFRTKTTHKVPFETEKDKDTVYEKVQTLQRVMNWGWVHLNTGLNSTHVK